MNQHTSRIKTPSRNTGNFKSGPSSFLPDRQVATGYRPRVDRRIRLCRAHVDATDRTCTAVVLRVSS